MHEQKDRTLSGEAILERVRERTEKIPPVPTVKKSKRPEQGPPVGKPVQIEFASKSSDILEPAVRDVRAWLETNVEGLRDISDTQSLPGMEWTLVDVCAAVYGANVTMVGTVVQMVTNGMKVAEYRPDDAEEEVDIRIRSPRPTAGWRCWNNSACQRHRGPCPYRASSPDHPPPTWTRFSAWMAPP